MSEAKDRYRMMYELTAGLRGWAGLLGLSIVLHALAESFGVSLLLPLLSGILGSESSAGGVLGRINVFLAAYPERTRLTILLTTLCVAVLIKSVLAVVKQYLQVYFVWRLTEKWSTKVFHNYLLSPLYALGTTDQGELVNNVIVEPKRAAKSVNFVIQLAGKLLISVCFAGVLVMTDWRVTLLMLVVALVAYLGTRGRTQRYSMRVGQKHLGLNQRAAGIATEALGAIKPVKAYGLQNHYVKGLRKRLKTRTRITSRFEVISDLPVSFYELVIVMGLAGFVLLIVHFTDKDLREYVPVLGLFSYVSVRIFMQVSFVLSRRMKILSFVPSLVLLHGMMTRETEREQLEKGEPLAHLDGLLRLEDVGFSHGGDQYVCRHLDMPIEHGKMTALVGPSGVGKSTIADIILRLRIPQEGRVTLDGKDVSGIELASWRERIGYVSQEPFVVSGTIRENILLGKPDATEEEIERAARLANAHDFIVAMADGYDSPVGQQGQGLSGGQRQRVAIARAVVRNPDLFIFDEATSSLDNESERLIREAIEGLAGSRTVFIIAHRLSTIQKADAIFRMVPGGGVEQISRADLDDVS